LIPVIILYMLLATTFTFGKAVLCYAQPIFFIAIRMLIAGYILLGYWAVKRRSFAIAAHDRFLFIQIILFHIYFSFILEFWGLQFVSSAKTCLLYNMAPFVTALFAYFLWQERLSFKKKIGLCIGFVGFAPVLLEAGKEVMGVSWGISRAEIVILVAVISAAYGWIVVKQLINRGYKPVFINGVGMFFGGCLALITSYLVEHGPRVFMPISCANRDSYQYVIEKAVSTCIPADWLSTALFLLYTLSMILIANIGCYNLYGHLLHTYSATFLSFAGFTCPFFAALFGWFFLREALTWGFIASNILVFVGLYLFYQEELSARGQKS
jgi:drug/metabolite transporter (DMT)-like permease